MHHGGFPTVVNASYVTPNNTQGGARLDTTFDQFDLNVVTEYVGQTGNLGGPLVSSFNESSRSDLRLYQSDDNQRMKELSQSTEVFFSTCQSLLGRMIDTVPRGVQLSEPLTPLTLKPVNVSFDIGQDGEMTLSGSIRVSRIDVTETAEIIKLLDNSTSLAPKQMHLDRYPSRHRPTPHPTKQMLRPTPTLAIVYSAGRHSILLPCPSRRIVISHPHLPSSWRLARLSTRSRTDYSMCHR